MPHKKIKLVIATNDFVLGGVQRLIVDTLRRLDRERFEIHLITLLQFPGKADFYDLVPADVKLIKHDFHGIWDVRQWYALYKTLREIRPDVVDSALFFSNTVFTVLKLFCAYQVITGEHNTGTRKPLAMRLVSRALAPLKYKVVADSNMVAQFVSRTEHIPLSRFRVIYNGVDLAEVEQAKKEYGARRNEIRRELGIAPDDFVFLNLSRVVAQKMHELAVEGFKRFTQGKEGYRLVIVGDGSHMSLIRGLVKRLGLQGAILLMGERRDVKRFYCLADAFLLTSRHEGFCIAAMEGLAFGLPLVSTKVAGVVEYLRDGENGYFIDDLTPEAVAEGMEKLMRSDQKAMREKAMSSAQPYSSERSAAAYQQLFLESAGPVRSNASNGARARSQAEKYLATCTEYTDPYEREKLIKDWIKKEHAAREAVEDFKRRAGPVAGTRILDIGFGGGEYTLAFARAGADVYGLEVNPVLLEIAEENLKEENVQATLRVYQGDILPFPDAFFDHAFSVSVLEHVSDAHKMLREVSRVLKPGGTFYLAYPNRWRPREAHTGIFFLSYLPRSFAQFLMWRLWKRNAVEELNLHFLSFWSLKKLLSGTSLRIRFEYASGTRLKRLVKRALSLCGVHHSAILGTVMVILEKRV